MKTLAIYLALTVGFAWLAAHTVVVPVTDAYAAFYAPIVDALGGNR